MASPIELEKLIERRADAVTKSDTHDILGKHLENCPAHPAVKEIQKDIKDLWKEVITLKALDHRVTAIEDALSTIEAAITSTTADIHKMQVSMAESNVVHLWAGRIIIALLSAAVSFLSAKYA
jgi:hypothetical protein